MSTELEEKQAAQIAGLEQELTRVRTGRKEADAATKAVRAELATLQTDTAKSAKSLKALEAKSAGFDAITESSAAKDATIKDLEAKLSSSAAKAQRDLAMADSGLPAKARDYFAFQYEAQMVELGDKVPAFDAFLEGLSDDPVAQAFKGEAAGVMKEVPPLAPAPAADAAPEAPEAPETPSSTLPDTEAGVKPSADPGAGAWAPGSSLRAAKENPAAFALKHGLTLNNPERHG